MGSKEIKKAEDNLNNEKQTPGKLQNDQSREPCRSLVVSSPRTIALYPPSMAQHPVLSGQLFGVPSSMFSNFGNACSKLKQLYSQMPTKLYQVQNNTDLRLAPSPSTLPHQPPFRPHSSSFQMAHRHIEYFTNMDVVSDAENIKDLIKMPFSPEATVSLIVHRIGNTLLIDSFPNYQLEQHRQEWAWFQDFQKYVCQTLLNKEPNQLLTKHEGRHKCWELELYSSLIQYTLLLAKQHQSTSANQSSRLPEGNACVADGTHLQQPGDTLQMIMESRAIEDDLTSDTNNRPTKALPSTERDSTTDAIIPISMMLADMQQPRAQDGSDVMPEPRVQDQIPEDANQNQSRNIVWNFENFKMLVGTDLPIFGGGAYPCVSLRLADMAQPINVLTGLDYWLDNLMCNVPEVAMCFHSSGVVQKYQRIKTEELPELSDSKFSPALVKDIAQNILAFLKQNTTHEGHTYWLLKREEEQIVKLYDLSSLTNDPNNADSPQTENLSSDSVSNPFTVPTGMLFYRVAKNLLSRTSKKTATITQLLLNAVKLLDSTRYPEIVASAHYHISDLLMHEDFKPEAEEDSSSEDVLDEDAPTLKEPSKKKRKNKKKIKKPQCTTIGRQVFVNPGAEETGEQQEEERDQVSSMKLSDLCKQMPLSQLAYMRYAHNYKPPKLSKDFIERCQNSLFHCAEGLQCLDDDDDDDDEEENNNSEEDEEPSSEHNPSHSPDSPPRAASPMPEPKMAKSYESIPLPYASLHDNASSTVASEQELASSEQVEVDTPDNNETVDSSTQQNASPEVEIHAQGDSSIVPSAPSLPVLLTKHTYYVKSWSSKLRAMLLHKVAEVYRLLTDQAMCMKLYDEAAEYILLSIQSCYAVCLTLHITTASNACAETKNVYPYLHQALIKGADVFYHKAKNCNTAIENLKHVNLKSMNKDEEKQKDQNSHENLKKTNESLTNILQEVMPEAYRTQFDIPYVKEDSFSLMEMSQCLLFLAVGGRMKSTAEQASQDIVKNLEEIKLNNNLPSTDCTSSSEDKTCINESGHTVSEIIRNTLNFKFEVTEDMLRNNPMILDKIAALMNEMSCKKLNEAEYLLANDSVDEEKRHAILDELLKEKTRLELAHHFFYTFLLDVANTSVTLLNLAKYHRLFAYYSDSRIEGLSYSKVENFHYSQAADCYVKAIDYLKRYFCVPDKANKRDRKNKQKRTKVENKEEESSKEHCKLLMKDAKIFLIVTRLTQASMIRDRPPEDNCSKLLCSILTSCCNMIDTTSVEDPASKLKLMNLAVEAFSFMSDYYFNFENPPVNSNKAFMYLEKAVLVQYSNGEYTDAMETLLKNVTNLNTKWETCKWDSSNISLKLLVHAEYLVTSLSRAVKQNCDKKSNKKNKGSAKVTDSYPLIEARLLEDYSELLKNILKTLCKKTASGEVQWCTNVAAKNAYKAALCQDLLSAIGTIKKSFNLS